VPDILEPAPASAEAPEKEAPEPTEPLPTAEEVFAQPPVFFGSKLTEEKTELRFAEDILVPRPAKPGDKAKGKKKKGAYRKENAEDGIRLKKRRQESEFLDEDEES
jgi:hypothetical protein